MEKETYVFIGRSGSGKGTQIKLLKNFIQEKFPKQNILHFESGARFRAFIEGDGYTNMLMRDILAKGDLAPDFITDWLFVDELVKYFHEDDLLLMDGFPRTMHQALVLDSAMRYYGRKNIKIIHIEVSEEEARKRMRMRLRADDLDEEVIEKRIRWYNENVLPTLEFFRAQEDRYQVLDINGEESIEEVFHSIQEKLKLND